MHLLYNIIIIYIISFNNNYRHTLLSRLVITATEYGYKREDGVYVIPIGCLKKLTTSRIIYG